MSEWVKGRSRTRSAALNLPDGPLAPCELKAEKVTGSDLRLVAFHIPGGLRSHKTRAHAGFHHMQAVQILRAVLGVREFAMLCTRISADITARSARFPLLIGHFAAVRHAFVIVGSLLCSRPFRTTCS